jgi:hypothetical protein
MRYRYGDTALSHWYWYVFNILELLVRPLVEYSLDDLM